MTSSDGGANPAELSTVKRALIEIRELRARIADLERGSRESIAITGVAIRTSGGVNDVSGFADLLWNGREAIEPIPATRWPIDQWYDEAQDTPGKMFTRFGGFIEDVDKFDAEFFGISPREAASMDPQQRLLLELAWHALEDAGFNPARLSGSKTGVYIGIANNDYGRALFSNPLHIDPYFGSGNAFSVAAGRLSYFLGLHGPSMAVDTACSSSLVAIHLACQALRSGECEVALAGGVNLILTPENNVNFCKAGMMSRDGRCKTFDAAADGYVRGEGAALIVLRRQSEAEARGERILALIRGTAVNQDGRSNGLTAPNGPAQEAVVRAALEVAKIPPRSVGYVEAHGTGTSLGDPIEVNALAAVLGGGRDATRPLAIGSVKTNIGHLEAAAGVAGLIKTILALQRREIPPHLHLQRPNPHIDWNSMPIVVPTSTTPWAPIDGRLLAGVSSFGFSGTNAHIILEEAPAPPAAAVDTQATQILTFSARDPAALAELTSLYARRLSEIDAAGESLGDFCQSANVGRAQFAHRTSIVGSSAANMSAALESSLQGNDQPAVLTGRATATSPRVAFLFPGQGAQYAGMGRQLYQSSMTFRAAFDECATLMAELLPSPIQAVIFEQAGAALLDETEYAQPAIFIIEYALARLWESWGIRPIAAMGHSFGEYAAACVAGVLSLADAVRMVVIRGRLVQALPRGGAMTVIGADEAAVRAAVEPFSGQVAIAAINGPANTVISGERSAVDAIARNFAASGARIKSLNVSHAFHSPLMNPVLDTFERDISDVVFSEPRITLISNLSGSPADLQLVGHSRYWREHLRNPVRFADAISSLHSMGITHYIEMSPHPVLLSMGSECVTGSTWIPSLRQGTDAWPMLLGGLQLLHGAGADIDWERFDQRVTRRLISVPSYPFQRKRHWIDPRVASPSPAGRTTQQRWQHMTEVMDRHAESGPLNLHVESYPEKWDCLARLTRAHAIHVLRSAQLFMKAGERHTLEAVMSAAGITSIYRHLVTRWLEGLVAFGALIKRADEYIADVPLADPNLALLWKQVDLLLADNQPLLDYVRHCGELLDAVLTGKESALETLFPGGSFSLAEALYERSSIMRYINSLAAAGLQALAGDYPPERKLRVLEVGAGTGGTSSALLPILQPGQVDYSYTDLSATFFDRARQRFARYPFIGYRLFDLERDPAVQGFELNSFDVVVSANAVHATSDMRAALQRLRSLLAPGGTLILLESTVHLDWFDMTTGLIEGWQSFADDLRTDNPLLASDAWIAALEQAGFEMASAWPRADSAASALAQHVIVARAAGEIAGRSAEPLSHTVTDPTTASAPEEVERDDWRQLLSQALPDERLDMLQELVRSKVMRVLQLDQSARPALSDRLMELGMDSLMAVQLRNSLGEVLQLESPLPSTLMFDYPTIDAIAIFLRSKISPDAAPVVASQSPHAPFAIRHSATAVAAMSDDEISKLLLEQATAS